MSLTDIALYVALLVYVVYRRVQGKSVDSVDSVKSLFVLPIVLLVLGYTSVEHATLNGIDVAVTVAGCALSLVLGAVRGGVNKLSVRDGRPWVRWGGASIVVFAVNVVVKLAIDVAGVAAGGTTSGTTSSLLLAVGLMLLGESAVVWLRLQSGSGASDAEMQSRRPPSVTSAGAADLRGHRSVRFVGGQPGSVPPATPMPVTGSPSGRR